MSIYETNFDIRLLLAVFILFLFVLVFSMGLNVQLFLFLNDRLNYIDPRIWAHITTYGDTIVAMGLMLIFCGRRPQIIWAIVIALFIGGILNASLKSLLDVVRPPGVLSLELFNVYGPMHVVHSFPSGHTLTAWTLISILISSLTSTWRWLLLLLAVLVGLSRIALGVHWPLDVLAGAFIGWQVGILSNYVSRRWSSGMRPELQRIFFVVILMNVIYMFWYDNGHPVTSYMQYILASICLFVTVPVWSRIVFINK